MSLRLIRQFRWAERVDWEVNMIARRDCFEEGLGLQDALGLFVRQLEADGRSEHTLLQYARAIFHGFEVSK